MSVAGCFMFNHRRVKCCDYRICMVHDSYGMIGVCDWIEWSEFSPLIHNLVTAGALERARKLGSAPWSWYPGCGLEALW